MCPEGDCSYLPSFRETVGCKWCECLASSKRGLERVEHPMILKTQNTRSTVFGCGPVLRWWTAAGFSCVRCLKSLMTERAYHSSNPHIPIQWDFSMLRFGFVQVLRAGLVQEAQNKTFPSGRHFPLVRPGQHIEALESNRGFSYHPVEPTPRGLEDAIGAESSSGARIMR